MFLFCSDNRRKRKQVIELTVTPCLAIPARGESGVLLFSGNTFWRGNPLIIGPGA
jgi:hypothetical protein